MIHLHGILSLAPTSDQQAIQTYSTRASTQTGVQFIDVDMDAAHYSSQQLRSALSPSKLGHIHWFCEMVLQAKDDDSRLVLCTGPDHEKITSCALLIGGYLILCEDYTPEQVAAALQPVEHLFVRYCDSPNDHSNVEIANQDCWRAIHLAKHHGWIDFLNQDVDPETCIDMEEYQHYDSPANGDLHVIVPSKLIAIRPPHDLSPDAHTGAARTWADDASCGPVFSPACYADVLCDFGVKLVVRCSQPTYDAAPLLDLGVAVEEMPDASSAAAAASLLRHIDRFLTLAQLAPGAIAVHADGRGLGAAEVLVAAFLVRRCAFPAGAAVAWARMTHPAGHVAALRFTAHDAPAA